VRFHIHLDLVDGLNARTVDEVIISVKSNSVTNEINSVCGKIELLDQLGERFNVNIDTFVSFGVLASKLAM